MTKTSKTQVETEDSKQSIAALGRIEEISRACTARTAPKNVS